MSAQPKLATSTEIKIDKGIPVPTGWGGPVSRFPLGAMEPGDSFLVIGTSRQGIHSAIERHRRRNPDTKFTTRADTGGFRVWRVS